MKRKFYFLTIPIVLITAGILLIYNQRDAMISHFLKDKLERIHESSGYQIHFGEVRTKGLRTIQLSDVTIENGDTIASIHHLTAQLSLWGILKGKHEIRKIETGRTQIHLAAKGETDSPELESDSTINFGKYHRTIIEKMGQLKKYVAVISDKLPKEIQMQSTILLLGNDTSSSKVFLPETTFKGNRVYTQVLIKEENQADQYGVVEGSSDNGKTDFSIYSLNGNALRIPFVEKKLNSSITFDTLHCQISILENEEERMRLKGLGEWKNLSIDNRRISSEKVALDHLSLDYLLSIGDNEVELDSTSHLTINHFDAHPYLHLVLKDTTPLLECDINSEKQPSSNLFKSLPHGLFKNLEGIETTGALDYHFHFKVDMAEIDSLEFSSSLNANDFSIVKMGATDFRSVSEPFVYHAYEDGKEVATVVLGEENPNYRPLDSISPYLQHAVMNSEDGAFYWHKGFLEHTIRASLVKDIQEKRFARGGSTISMQLIKNLWLSREKTITRKVEEALIVWLVENKRLLSKERMYEIYLNIIEWGPNVYGANQAAKFYFNKEASQLTLEEAIFMASVIPRPKKFYWSFDKEGKLHEYLANYYQVIGEKMMKREIITEEQFNELKPEVTITGEAKRFITIQPSQPFEKMDMIETDILE